MAVKADRREQTRLPLRSKKGRKRARTGTTGKRRARASHHCAYTLLLLHLDAGGEAVRSTAVSDVVFGH